jgi:large subunit ribosomal protein L14
MKAISSKVTKCLPVGAVINCADNTGVKEMQIISVKSYKGTRRTKPKAGVGSWVNVKVIRGTEKVRHEVHKAVIIRQRKEYKRPDGTSISFEDNAGVLIDDKGDPRGTFIKGPVAKEAIERFGTVGKISRMVV